MTEEEVPLEVKEKLDFIGQIFGLIKEEVT